ncbi:aldo/keto reductase family oxidoreductase [Colwellia asteriadis]|uniref:Aldo/keto reductase family oxidoreductase n=1 Tax=Colwellia asteriadis TaxID=517723 RepID=A0ABN1LAI7_9GAMM
MITIPKITMAPHGPVFSTFVQGYWRLGAWNFTAQQRLSFLKSHVELGITTVDNAAIYGNSEQLFGEALKLDKSMREQIEIVSKFGINGVAPSPDSNRVSHYDSSKEAIITSTENSLKRLGVEQLDALLVHRPDLLMNADEVAEAFELLHQSGKVKHFGVSNFSASQFELLQSRLSKPLITNQVEINPLNFNVFEDGTADQLQRLRIRPMAWSCLAGGSVFDKNSEKAIRLHKTLHELVEEIGASSIEQVIYAWILKHPSKPVALLGSRNLERIKEATGAITLTMNAEQWYRVWVAAKGHGVA